MELKKASNHPFLFEGAETRSDNREETLKGIVTNSGKMVLLDKLLARLKQDGHRVLVFSQMVRMLLVPPAFPEKACADALMAPATSCPTTARFVATSISDSTAPFPRRLAARRSSTTTRQDRLTSSSSCPLALEVSVSTSRRVRISPRYDA